MTLAFKAKSVRCADAMDGEMLEVLFDTLPESADAGERATPYVLVSQNFEFPGPATIEWHDGSDYDGGADITSVTLTRDRVLIRLSRDVEIIVSFSIGDKRFAELTSYLRRMLDEHVFSTR